MPYAVRKTQSTVGTQSELVQSQKIKTIQASVTLCAWIAVIIESLKNTHVLHLSAFLFYLFFSFVPSLSLSLTLLAIVPFCLIIVVEVVVFFVCCHPPFLSYISLYTCGDIMMENSNSSFLSTIVPVVIVYKFVRTVSTCVWTSRARRKKMRKEISKYRSAQNTSVLCIGCKQKRNKNETNYQFSVFPVN